MSEPYLHKKMPPSRLKQIRYYTRTTFEENDRKRARSVSPYSAQSYKSEIFGEGTPQKSVRSNKRINLKQEPSHVELLIKSPPQEPLFNLDEKCHKKQFKHEKKLSGIEIMKLLKPQTGGTDELTSDAFQNYFSTSSVTLKPPSSRPRDNSTTSSRRRVNYSRNDSTLSIAYDETSVVPSPHRDITCRIKGVGACRKAAVIGELLLHKGGVSSKHTEAPSKISLLAPSPNKPLRVRNDNAMPAAGISTCLLIEQRPGRPTVSPTFRSTLVIR